MLSGIIANALKSVRQSAGVPVVYARGDQFVSVVAVPGQTDFGGDDNNGVILEYRTRDFLFASCDLRFGSTPIVPTRGDQVKEDNGTAIYVYEVSRPDGNEQPWRYSDYGRSQIRVHTKLKETIAK